MSKKIRWSTLARIGRTTPMRMTVLIPFIGAILLFNETTADWIRLPNQVGLDFNLDAEQIESINLYNLYFTYFGLVLLGIGSIVFGLTCPTEIQSHQSITDALISRSSVQTPILTKRLFRDLLIQYIEKTCDITNEENPRILSLHVTDDVQSAVHDLFTEIHSRSNLYDEYMKDLQDKDLEDWRFRYAMNQRGDIWPDRIILDFYDAPMALFGIVQEFYEIASSMEKDVLSVWYLVYDTSRFWTRFLVAFLFFTGLFALLIPSSVTFYKVASVLITRLNF